MRATRARQVENIIQQRDMYKSLAKTGDAAKEARLAMAKELDEVKKDHNCQLDKISGKHEESVKALREELLESHQKQSKAEVEADRLRLENSHLTASQTRLLTENDAMMKDRGAWERTNNELREKAEGAEAREKAVLEQMQKEGELQRRELDMEREKYQRELMLHAMDIEALNELQSEIKQKRNMNIKMSMQTEEQIRQLSQVCAVM